MHHHIRRDERIALGTLLREGLSQTEIADRLGVHRSTISKELRRNAREDGGYHATHAQVRARNRRQLSKVRYRKIENDPALASRIERMLEPLISPEVVAHECGLHHQTIYAWIYRTRQDLKAHLPYQGKKRRRYGKNRAKKQGWTANVRSIHERAEEKPSWEGDTITGTGKARLLTHVERNSLYLRADLIPDGTADAVHAVLKKDPLPGTLTYDRGSEFALWQMIERDTGATVFFADPHAPHQRGKNENTNGRLRRPFPKRTDLSTITKADVARVVWKMNHTKRKSLSWQTPAAVFEKLCCDSG